MLVVWILLGWVALAVPTAVVFAAVGRSALREDEALARTRSRDEAPVPADREAALSS